MSYITTETEQGEEKSPSFKMTLTISGLHDTVLTRYSTWLPRRSSFNKIALFEELGRYSNTPLAGAHIHV